MCRLMGWAGPVPGSSTLWEVGEKRGRELIGGQDLTVQKKFLDLGSLPRGDP